MLEALAEDDSTYESISRAAGRRLPKDALAVNPLVNVNILSLLLKNIVLLYANI